MSKFDAVREYQYRRAARDPWYFLTNFWKVNHIGKGYLPMAQWEHQPEIVDAMIRADASGVPERQVYLKARQIGFTTIGFGFAFWSMFFHEHRPWLSASTGEGEAKDSLSTKLAQPYSMLPAWFRRRGPQVIKDTTEEWGLDNGSRMLSIPSTASAGRSKAVWGVLMDEAAFMEKPHDLFAALDPLCYGPMFVFSTANGMGNFFHQKWTDSQVSDSAWSSMFFPWSVVPGRDGDWYERTKRRYRGTEHLFFQEYPASPAEAFAKSGKTALPLEILEKGQDWTPPLLRYDASLWWNDDPEPPLDRSLMTGTDDKDIELHVWQEPYVEYADDGQVVQKPNYVVAVDTAEGLEYGDFSAIAVIDANSWQTVATLKANVPIHLLGRLTAAIGYWYHTALVIVERNNAGLVPLTHLQEIRYPRLYRMDTLAQIRLADRTPRYGWVTSRQSKPKMLNDFLDVIDRELILLYDQRFLDEAYVYLSDGKGGGAAKDPNNDDLVTATMIAVQGALDVGEYPIVWTPSTVQPATYADVFRIKTPGEARGVALGSGIGQTTVKATVRPSFVMKVKEG